MIYRKTLSLLSYKVSDVLIFTGNYVTYFWSFCPRWVKCFKECVISSWI